VTDILVGPADTTDTADGDCAASAGLTERLPKTKRNAVKACILPTPSDQGRV